VTVAVAGKASDGDLREGRGEMLVGTARWEASRARFLVGREGVEGKGARAWHGKRGQAEVPGTLTWDYTQAAAGGRRHRASGVG